MEANVTFITVIGLAILSFMIIGMFISQSRHRALEAKNAQIRQLDLQHRRLKNLLRSLPPNYLSVELRDFIYQALLQNLKMQIGLVTDKNDLLKSDYQLLVNERERVKQNPPPPLSNKLTADQASIYRGLLKSLYQFIQRNYETGRLNKDHAEKILKQVELKLVDTAIDYFVLVAKEYYSTGKYKQTRNAYQKALDIIESSPYEGQFKQESVKIRNELNKIVDQWRESRAQASLEASDKLADGIESYVDDQDSWKKKQTYE